MPGTQPPRLGILIRTAYTALAVGCGLLAAMPAHALIGNATPSKIAVSSSPPAQILPAVTTPVTMPAAVATRAPAQTRRSTPSKVAVNAQVAQVTIAPAAQQPSSRANLPVLSASVGMPSMDVVSDVSSQQARINALKAYLSTPSKTPVAALEAQSIRSSLLPLQLDASSVLIVDQDSQEVLYIKNAQDVMPIASITKLMTAMVLLDARQSMSQRITITQADVDTLKNSSSRLAVGTQLTRRELLHLTLMSSENRAAHALARNYPGGLRAFVTAMNRKAQSLGMTQTTYTDPTGLSSLNRSSARDLVWLTKAAYGYEQIRQWSTSAGYKAAVGKRRLQFINSNRLTDDASWRIGLQKTGYIREAGHCLVMQASVSGRRLIMVFLDSDGRESRISDAEKMRTWVSSQSRASASNARSSVSR